MSSGPSAPDDDVIAPRDALTAKSDDHASWESGSQAIGGAEHGQTTDRSRRTAVTTRLRILVTLDRRRDDAWHRAVVDAMRAESIDVIVSHGASDRAPDPDAVVDLGGGSLDIEPRLGVWRFGFGDGAPVADGAPGTLARLYRTTAD